MILKNLYIIFLEVEWVGILLHAFLGGGWVGGYLF